MTTVRDYIDEVIEEDNLVKDNEELTRHFRKGCESNGLDADDVQENWLGYFQADQLVKHTHFEIADLPDHSEHCICGHKIYNQCYMVSPDFTQIEVIGIDCIKKFIKGSKSMRCELCDIPCRQCARMTCKACKDKRTIFCACGSKIAVVGKYAVQPYNCKKCKMRVEKANLEKREYFKKKQAERDKRNQ